MKKIAILLILLCSMLLYGTTGTTIGTTTEPAPAAAPGTQDTTQPAAPSFSEYRNSALINIDSNGKVGGFDKALESYINERGRDADLIFSLGNEYFKLGKYEKAFKTFSKDKTTAKNLFGAGTTARLTGDYAIAVEFYDQALSKNSKMAEAYLGRGLAYRGLKSYDEAISDLTRYLSYKKSESVYLGIGGIYIETEDYKEAANILSKGKAAFPGSKAISDMLAKVNKKLRDIK